METSQNHEGQTQRRISGEELVQESEGYCPLFIAQALQELGAGCFRCRRKVRRRKSVVGHGDAVVQGADVGCTRGEKGFRGEVS